MKKNLLKNIINIIVLVSTLISPVYVYSAELGSSNYKIVGATTKGGGVIETTDGDYAALLTVGEIGNDPRHYSLLYEMFNDPENAFIANVPEVSCFETTTDGSSSCTTGPSELTTGGMVAICGAGGCYNKARFEIDTNSNPSDTLYSIAISQDNFASDIKYVDGSTYRLETISTHDLNDYKTKTDWETETFNIQGLQSQTQYYIRITALHGSFTESDPSPVADTTTGLGTIFFDIDIANSSGTTADNSGPYSISFTGDQELIGGSAAITATNRIWLDAETNSEGGFAILVKGVNGGLTSATTSDTIDSVTGNLDTLLSGFGIQSEYIDYDDTNPLLGDITAQTGYNGTINGTINSVGIVDTTANKIYDADGPIADGRMSLKLIAKPGTQNDASTDYQEDIHFIFVPRY